MQKKKKQISHDLATRKVGSSHYACTCDENGGFLEGCTATNDWNSSSATQNGQRIRTARQKP